MECIDIVACVITVLKIKHVMLHSVRRRSRNASEPKLRTVHDRQPTQNRVRQATNPMPREAVQRAAQSPLPLAWLCFAIETCRFITALVSMAISIIDPKPSNMRSKDCMVIAVPSGALRKECARSALRLASRKFSSVSWCVKFWECVRHVLRWLKSSMGIHSAFIEHACMNAHPLNYENATESWMRSRLCRDIYNNTSQHVNLENVCTLQNGGMHTNARSDCVVDFEKSYTHAIHAMSACVLHICT